MIKIHLSKSAASSIKREYIEKRLDNPLHYFDKKEVALIDLAYKLYPESYNKDHPYVKPSVYPVSKYEIKPLSDELAIRI